MADNAPDGQVVGWPEPRAHRLVPRRWLRVLGAVGRGRWVLLGLMALLLAVVVLGLGIGAVAITPGQTLAILGAQVGIALSWEFTAQQQAVLLTIRAPRIVLGVLVGASLREPAKTRAVLPQETALGFPLPVFDVVLMGHRRGRAGFGRGPRISRSAII